MNKKNITVLLLLVITGMAGCAQNIKNVTENTMTTVASSNTSNELTEQNNFSTESSDDSAFTETDNQIHESPHVKPIITSMKDDNDNEVGEIVMPEIENIADKNILSKIQSILNYTNIVGESQDDTISNFKTCGCGTTGVDYTIHYDKNNILDIAFTIEGLGAYPDLESQNYAIELSTGELLKADEIFNPKSLGKLVALCNNILQKNISIAKQNAQSDPEYNSMFPDVNYTFNQTDLENFTIENTGIEFDYDFDFPHVIKAMEPKSSIFFSYKELAPYLSKNSPFN